MFVSALTKDDLNDKIVDRVLFEGLEDTGEDADCAIVLGSIKAAEYRLPVAVKAYRDNRLNKLILCGGKVRDFSEGSMTEARQMQFHAERLGVKQEDIMLDEH
ncbi:MAG: YdcF family protein, partial [Oscillospiraceae bacterium]|nr:YdcF family protein [Oscillospiraceae bacterium]